MFPLLHETPLPVHPLTVKYHTLTYNEWLDKGARTPSTFTPEQQLAQLIVIHEGQNPLFTPTAFCCSLEFLLSLHHSLGLGPEEPLPPTWESRPLLLTEWQTPQVCVLIGPS